MPQACERKVARPLRFPCSRVARICCNDDEPIAIQATGRLAIEPDLTRDAAIFLKLRSSG